MTDEKLERANEIYCLIKDIDNLCDRFIRLRNGVCDRIDLSYEFMHEDNLKRGFADTCINYLKEQLEKYKKEFDEL